MKHPRFLLRALSLVMMGVVVSAPVVTNPAQTDDSSSALAAMASKVHYETLPNGIRVILYNRGIAPVFSGAVVVRVGGSDEVVGETGISHLFEHMAFKGTKTVGTKDFSKEQRLLRRLEEISAESDAANHLTAEQKAEWDEIHEELKEIWIGDDFSRRYEQHGGVGQNATTDKEFTKYFVDLPRSAFEFWCRMESDRLISPVMRQFYQERDVVLEERRMRFDDDPGGRLYELLLGVAYQRHPYRAPVIGYEKDIRGLTATELEAFRKKYYVPSNIVVSVVGRVNPAEDMKLISKYFGAIPTAPAIKRDIDTEPEPTGERRVTLKMRASPQIIIAYAKPNYPNPDDPPLTVAAEILAGSKISPLYVELVKRRQLAAAIGQEEGPGVAYPNLLMFEATVKAPHTNDALLYAFDSVMDRFRRNGPTQEQLDIAKRSIGMEYLGHLQSSQSLALDFASSELVYGSWKASVEWYDKMTQVTVDDVKRVAQKYLVDDRRTIATIEREK